MGRVRKSRRLSSCTHTEVMVQFFCAISLPFRFVLLALDWFRATSSCGILLLSPRFSTLKSLIRGYLKVSNHLNFFSLVYIQESRRSQVFLKLLTLGRITFRYSASLHFFSIRNVPWFIWFFRRLRNSRGHTSHLGIASRHAYDQAYHPNSLFVSSVEETTAFCLL